MKPIVYIIRGHSGSGKSTLALNLVKALDAVHCEADQYWYLNDSNIYNFDYTKLHLAHQYCYNKAEQALIENKNVVISNTNTTNKDIKIYKDLCTKYSVIPNIVVCLNSFKNIHSVPEDKVQLQKDKLLNSLINELKNTNE